MTRGRLGAAVAVASLLLLMSGCTGSADATSTDASSSGTPAPTAAATQAPLTGELTVYAAASLRSAFDEIATQFAAENPGVSVNPIVYDGSSTLATQIIGGAQPDVFASADEANMAKVTDEGLATGPELFASNTLVIVVPKGNPGGVKSLSDLADDTVTVVLCAPAVPCGAASATLLANAGVAVTPASVEQNVTAVLTKIQSDEADAGLVYATDVRGNAAVDSIVPDGAAEVVNRYPIVALADAPNPEAAAAFTAFVLGSHGQKVLDDLGFGAP